VQIGFFQIEVEPIEGLFFDVVIGEKSWWGKGVINETREHCSMSSPTTAVSKKLLECRSPEISPPSSTTRRKAGTTKARCAAITFRLAADRGSISISSVLRKTNGSIAAMSALNEQLSASKGIIGRGGELRLGDDSRRGADRHI
jgi:hypothetical protein